MNASKCQKCNKNIQFANVQLSCNHSLCDQCLRSAHVQTQIANQNQQNQQNQIQQTKTNQLNCPVCSVTNELILEHFTYVQKLLLEETMIETSDKLDQQLEESNIILQNDQQDPEQLQEQKKQEMQELQKLRQEIDLIQNKVNTKNENQNRIKAQCMQAKNEIANKKQELLNKTLRFQNLCNQSQYKLNQGQELNQLQQINKELQQRAQENKQSFSNLFKLITPINQKAFENIKIQYQEVMVIKNQNEEKRKKNQEEIDRIKNKQKEIDNIKRNLSTLNEEIYKLNQKNKLKEEKISHQKCNACYMKQEKIIKYQCGCQICDICILNYLKFLYFNLDKKINKVIDVKCINCNKNYDISDIQIIESNLVLKQGINELLEKIKHAQQIDLGTVNLQNEQNIPIENVQNNFYNQNQNPQHIIIQHQQIDHQIIQENQYQAQENENQHQNGYNRDFGDQYQNAGQNFEIQESEVNLN